MKSCSFQDSAHMASARNKIYQRLRRCTHTFSLVSWVHGSKKHVLFRDVWVLMAEFGLVKKYVRSIAAGYWDGPLLSPKGVQPLKWEENFEDTRIHPPKKMEMFVGCSSRLVGHGVCLVPFFLPWVFFDFGHLDQHKNPTSIPRPKCLLAVWFASCFHGWCDIKGFERRLASTVGNVSGVWGVFGWFFWWFLGKWEGHSLLKTGVLH